MSMLRVFSFGGQHARAARGDNGDIARWFQSLALDGCRGPRESMGLSEVQGAGGWRKVMATSEKPIDFAIRNEPCDCQPDFCWRFVDPPSDCVHHLDGDVRVKTCPNHPG